MEQRTKNLIIPWKVQDWTLRRREACLTETTLLWSVKKEKEPGWNHSYTRDCSNHMSNSFDYRWLTRMGNGPNRSATNHRAKGQFKKAQRLEEKGIWTRLFTHCRVCRIKDALASSPCWANWLAWYRLQCGVTRPACARSRTTKREERGRGNIQEIGCRLSVS